MNFSLGSVFKAGDYLIDGLKYYKEPSHLFLLSIYKSLASSKNFTSLKMCFLILFLISRVLLVVVALAGVDCVMVHTWGRNPNTTLGHDRSKEHPEKLDLPLGGGTSVVQVSAMARRSVSLF